MIKPEIVLIAAGGTGGHIYPALAVAKHIAEKGRNIVWITDSSSLSKSILSKQDFKILHYSMLPLRGASFLHSIKSIFLLFCTILKLCLVLRKYKISMAISFGGYASAAGAIVAKVFRAKLILHEQNRVMGLVNRLLSKFADKIITGMPMLNTKYNNKSICIGNPVMPEFYDTFEEKNDIFLPIKILVLGGSQGCDLFNQKLPSIFKDIDNISVWHQSGIKHAEKTKVLYKNNSNLYKLSPYISDIVKAYSWADLVISRAGAMTISEIMVAGKASILVPLPFSADNHQYLNAEYMQIKKAALLVEQHDLSKIKSIINNFKKDVSLITNFSQNSKLAAPSYDCVNNIYNECLK